MIREKIQKKYTINTNAISEKYKIQKKIRTQNFKNTKKNTNPKFQKYKIQKIQIQKWDREPTPCPFWKARTHLQNKCKANLFYFLTPAIQFLYFWVVFFRTAFVFLILYRRPFSSQRRLLNMVAACPAAPEARVPRASHLGHFGFGPFRTWDEGILQNGGNKNWLTIVDYCMWSKGCWRTKKEYHSYFQSISSCQMWRYL